MVRSNWHFGGALHGFPHASGDGPLISDDDNTAGEFSPREWGWSEAAAFLTAPTLVFPTRVGMVRNKLSGMLITISFPHASGDGPVVA